MPNPENIDAPDKVYIHHNKAEGCLRRAWWPSPQSFSAHTEYLRATPARAAAEQMLEALKALTKAADEMPYGHGVIEQDALLAASDEALAAIAAAQGDKG